jgi:hypothetical protein
MEIIMRHYYDTQLTPATQKTYLEGGDNRYPETDPKVSSWFNQLPDGFTRAFDTVGFPILVEIPQKSAAELAAIETSNQIEQLKSELTIYFNSVAKAAGFFDLLNAGKYTGFVNSRQVKAETLLAWVSDCWDIAEAEAVKVADGAAMPTITDIKSLLPPEPLF